MMTCLFSDRTALRSCSHPYSCYNFNCLATVCYGSVMLHWGEKKKREKIADMLFGAKNKNKSFHLFIFYLKQRFIGPVKKWIMDMQTAEQKQ